MIVEAFISGFLEKTANTSVTPRELFDRLRSTPAGLALLHAGAGGLAGSMLGGALAPKDKALLPYLVAGGSFGAGLGASTGYGLAPIYLGQPNAF